MNPRTVFAAIFRAKPRPRGGPVPYIEPDDGRSLRIARTSLKTQPLTIRFDDARASTRRPR